LELEGRGYSRAATGDLRGAIAPRNKLDIDIKIRNLKVNPVALLGSFDAARILSWHELR
jgi:hypothetical protein